MAGDALFGRVYVRVTGHNRRVIVVEPLQSRVSIWTPDGRRLADLGGPGEGPGDLTLPSHVDLDDTGFYVRDGAKFSFFSYDGMPLGTVPSLPTSVSWQGHYVQARVVLDDGSFLGYPLIPASIEFGLWGDDPIHTTPVLRVRKTGGRWAQNEVLRYNHRNSTLRVPIGDGSYFAAQPYSDSDWPRWDRETASLLLGRRVGEDLRPGEAELVEVSASGDTVWRRRVALAPVRLTQAILRPTLDSLEAMLKRREADRPGILGLGGRSARDLAEEVLYAPEYLPAFSSFMLSASSGQVWAPEPGTPGHPERVVLHRARRHGHASPAGAAARVVRSARRERHPRVGQVGGRARRQLRGGTEAGAAAVVGRRLSQAGTGRVRGVARRPWRSVLGFHALSRRCSVRPSVRLRAGSGGRGCLGLVRGAGSPCSSRRSW